MQKQKPIRDPAHLKFIRSLPCVTCGATPSQAAHIRRGGDGGMGMKPSDSRCVPLCHVCHREQHTVGEVSFWYPFTGYEAAAVLAKKLYEVSGNHLQAIELITKFRGRGNAV